MASDVFSVRLGQDLIEQIDFLRGTQPRNAFIRDALQEAVESHPFTVCESWEELRRTLCGLAQDAGLNKPRFELEIVGSTESPESLRSVCVRLSRGPTQFQEQVAARLNHLDGRIRSLELSFQESRRSSEEKVLSRLLDYDPTQPHIAGMTKPGETP